MYQLQVYQIQCPLLWSVYPSALANVESLSVPQSRTVSWHLKTGLVDEPTQHTTDVSPSPVCALLLLQKIKQATIASLVRLSYPDLPLTIAAFLAGAVAALASASVPYFIGQVIDFASIDPDRWVSTGVLVA